MAAAKQAGAPRHPRLSLAVVDDLAHQTTALFDSLKQLNALMNGPRGKELSPKANVSAAACNGRQLAG